MTPRRRRPDGSSGSDGGTPNTPTPNASPAGRAGDGVTVDPDGIDTMADRLGSTGGRVDNVGRQIDSVDLSSDSMGVFGAPFVGSAQTQVQQARQNLTRTRQAVQNAETGTRATAQSYRDTDRTNADNLGNIDTDTTPPRTNPSGTTTPSGATDGPGTSGTPGGGSSGNPPSIGDRLDGNDSGGPPPPNPPRTGRDGDDGSRQPDRNPPPPRRDGQSLGRFSEDRLTRDSSGRITHVDGKPVQEKLREIARERTQEYMNEKNGKNPDGSDRPGGKNAELSGGQTGNIVAHVMDTRTGEIFETTNGPKGSEIPPSQVHPEVQRRVDEMRANGPYPEFDKNGNPIPGTSQPYPGFDLPLRHAEVRGVNEALHANPGATIDDMIADTTFMRADGLKDAPFCANCSGILHEVPSNSHRREYDPDTGRIVERRR
ncbi:type VII secretion target [Actinophytocola xanthii]|uniref:YwqJ-like deaminase n=1 Tax=Actinophytocola xanthii TaxID=1912961 RepID=A0A1Q8CRK0_9PSEU|nr:type VII secretion target [Actinophytocola xanthii]OLF16985.1 hypothetical protein BU204_13680 [Actinophytocola xanthii]